MLPFPPPINCRPRVTIREATVWLLFILAVSVAFLLFGCGQATPDAADASGDVLGAQRGAAPPPPPGAVPDAGVPDVFVSTETNNAPVQAYDGGAAGDLATSCPAGSVWDEKYAGYNSTAATGCCVIVRAGEKAQVVACW